MSCRSEGARDASKGTSHAELPLRLASISIVLIALGVLACSRDLVEHSLVDKFGVRRPALDSLKAMSDEDTAFARIAPDFISPNVSPPMSPQRWERYRELFRRIDSDGGLVRRYDGSVLIFDGTSGMLGAGATYGYVFFPEPPPATEVLPRLSGAGAGSRFYRHLEGKWYLEQDR